jgi:hypothetical protein
MADDSETRLSHRLVVPIRDTPHAPFIFFETAPVSGYADGIVSIILGASCPQIRPNGEVRGEAVVTAHLKCSIQAAVNLRDAGALHPYRLRNEPRAIILVAYQVRLEGDVQRRRNLSPCTVLTAPLRPAQRSCRSGLLKDRLELGPLRRPFCEPIDVPR